jgi:hypothetical protein
LTTFRPHNKKYTLEKFKLKNKNKLNEEFFQEIKAEVDKYTNGDHLPDYYIQKRQKHFIQFFLQAIDKVGTFM